MDPECAICGQVLCMPVTTSCRHTFCRCCLSVGFRGCLALPHWRVRLPHCRPDNRTNCERSLTWRRGGTGLAVRARSEDVPCLPWAA